MTQRIGSPLPDNAETRRNSQAMGGLVDDLAKLVAGIAAGGPQASRDRHVARGKLLPRQRVERLLDPGTAFLEIGQLAAHGVYDDDVPAAGMIAGVGQVAGKLCVIVANDPTVKGGSYYPLTVKKHLRAQEIAVAEPACRASISSTAAGPTCRGRTRSFPTASISAASSSIRRT